MGLSLGYGQRVSVLGRPFVYINIALHNFGRALENNEAAVFVSFRSSFSVAVRAFFYSSCLPAMLCFCCCCSYYYHLLLLFFAALLALHDLLAVVLPLFLPLLCTQTVNKKLLFKFACVSVSVCVCAKYA